MCAFLTGRTNTQLAILTEGQVFAKREREKKPTEDITMDTTVEGNVFLLFYSYFGVCRCTSKTEREKNEWTFSVKKK